MEEPDERIAVRSRPPILAPSLFNIFLKTFISQTNIIMTGKLFRPWADSDSSESWNRNRFWLMLMVESQSESFEIELEL